MEKRVSTNFKGIQGATVFADISDDTVLVRVREHTESVLCNILGCNLDTVDTRIQNEWLHRKYEGPLGGLLAEYIQAVCQAIKNENSSGNPSSIHVQLVQIIHNIRKDARSNEKNNSSAALTQDLVEHQNSLTHMSYEDVLATVLINKIHEQSERRKSGINTFYWDQSGSAGSSGGPGGRQQDPELHHPGSLSASYFQQAPVAKKEATGTSYNQRSVAECSTTESDTDTSGIEKDSLEDFSARSSFPVESVRILTGDLETYDKSGNQSIESSPYSSGRTSPSDESESTVKSLDRSLSAVHHHIPSQIVANSEGMDT